MYIQKHLAVAARLVQGYKAPQPFSLCSKQYFSANKQHGSRDRKTISALCYAYFRLGNNIASATAENRMLLGICLSQPEIVQPDWLPLIQQAWPFIDEAFLQQGLGEKAAVIAQQVEDFTIERLFPHSEALSAQAQNKGFYLSHLQRPLVWLRAKTRRKEALENILHEQKTPVLRHPFLPLAIGLPQETNIEILLGKSHHQLAEVQDASSQYTGTLMDIAEGKKVWDCCCGAGGKSLMLEDTFKNIELYCSDVRPAIVTNLLERFGLAQARKPYTAIADVGTKLADKLVFENKNERKTATHKYFDVIVADVPCSGSGTWARTPEQSLSFKQEEIDRYTALQRTIVANVLPFLKPGGKLYYITCSVYAAENEGQLAYFETLGLQPVKYQLIEGYPYLADTMFLAELVKN